MSRGLNARAVDLIATIRQIANESIAQLPRAMEGVVVPGSWDPAEGTVHVLIGTTATLADHLDPDADVLTHEPLPVMGNHIGDQGGPVGMERCTVIPVDGGWRVLLEHGPDDSPGAPAGEKHTYLRSLDQALVKECFVKIQHDAVRLGHAKKIISIANTVELGKENIDQDGYRVVRDSDLQTVVDNLTNAVQEAFNNLCQYIQGGQGVAPPQVRHTQSKGSSVTFSS